MNSNTDVSAKDAATIRWEEFTLRQQHYWSSFHRFALAIITINVVPYVKPELSTQLGTLVIVFPFTAFLLSLATTWLLHAEYQRLQMVRQCYDALLRGVAPIPPMPRERWWQRLAAFPIGLVTSLLFGVGFTFFSVLNGIVLIFYPGYVTPAP